MYIEIYRYFYAQMIHSGITAQINAATVLTRSYQSVAMHLFRE